MHLLKLPPELCRLVLQSLDSIHDLHRAITASSLLFRTFCASRSLILSAVLRHVIHPVALPHALAAISVPELLSNPADYMKALEPFLDRYFAMIHDSDSAGIPFPPQMVDICRLVKLYNRVCRLMKDYAYYTVHALYTGSNHEPPNQREKEESRLALARRGGDARILSWTERGRMQRAFFRFELYSQCFPLDPRADSQRLENSFISGHSQDRVFISRLSFWETEELVCVYEYFYVRTIFVVRQVEEDFITRVLQLAKHRHSSCWHPDSSTFNRTAASLENGAASQPETSTGTSESSNNSWCDFSGLDIGVLTMFSDVHRIQVPSFFHFIVSLGLPYLDQVISTKNTERRKDLIRSRFPCSRDFLPEALSGYSRTNLVVPRANLKPAADGNGDDDPRLVNLGYKLYAPKSPIVFVDTWDQRKRPRAWPIRRLGYVFWDANRINETVPSKHLMEAKNLEKKRKLKEVLSIEGIRSSEERLAGLRVPLAMFRQLESEFGGRHVDLSAELHDQAES